MQEVTIFIGYEERQRVAAETLRYSLVKNSAASLDIVLLGKETVTPYYHRPRHPLQSTEFTFYRFCIPELMQHRGVALYLDCDMLVLGDISEVLKLDMSVHAIRVVKQKQTVGKAHKMGGELQTPYDRKNWSSFMLMDCTKLGLWNWDSVNTWNGLDLQQFRGISDGLIGDIPLVWNSLDYCDSDTKNIHYTSGGPWMGVTHPFADIWTSYAIAAARSGNQPLKL